jgi:hypothetical protein
MVGSIEEFKDNIDGVQKISLFEVIFGNAKDKGKLKFRTSRVKLKRGRGTTVTFTMYEDENALVRSNIPTLDGPVEIITYKKGGEIANIVKGNFTLYSAVTVLDWNINNAIQTWKITGKLT